jgi:isopentenyl diphosphate isomerase/L-lactate dehydrogenase-like FMN-dependent dehydrogenase
MRVQPGNHVDTNAPHMRPANLPVTRSGERIVKLDDFRLLAKKKLPPAVFDYIDCGACDEITSHANQRDFDDIKLLPLSLRDVSNLDLSVTILGQSFDSPIGFSPTAFHTLVHKRGAIATAAAAKSLKVLMILSSMTSFALEHIAQESDNNDLWLQIYIFKDRGLTKLLVERAERAGFKAIVVTIGTPVVGKRDRNIRNRFSLPEHVAAANFKTSSDVAHNNPVHAFHGAELDPSLTWSDIEWLTQNCRLPVLVKGVSNPMDVAPALDLNISGIIVSNHGGRQLDTTLSTIKILPEVANRISGRVPLLVDSGIRRGTDVLKAIALGADGVLLGRPVMWALGVDGQNGVVRAVNLLTEELRIAMQIVGCSTIADIRKHSSYILRKPSESIQG